MRTMSERPREYATVDPRPPLDRLTERAERRDTLHAAECRRQLKATRPPAVRARLTAEATAAEARVASCRLARKRLGFLAL